MDCHIHVRQSQGHSTVTEFVLFLFSHGSTALVDVGLLYKVPRSYSDTPHSVDSFGRVISPSQRPVRDNTQHTDIHVPGGIRTHNPSKRTAVDPRLRPRGHWDRRICIVGTLKLFKIMVTVSGVFSRRSQYRHDKSHSFPSIWSQLSQQIFWLSLRPRKKALHFKYGV
jgi:hypothetical protein